MIIVMLGTPGSGRHTQGHMIQQHWGIQHVSLRDLLHEELGKDTPLAKELAPAVNEGKALDNSLIYQLFNQKLETYDFKQGIVMNGFPVALKQLKSLQNALKRIDCQIDHAVYLDVPTKESVRRLAGRRVCKQCATEYHVAYKPPEQEGVCDHCRNKIEHLRDDQPDVATKRIEWFREVSAPLVQAFEEMKLLRKFDGVKSVEAVHRAISESIR